MHKIFELREMGMEQLHALASELNIKGFKKMDKDALVYAILDEEARHNAHNAPEKPAKPKRGRPRKSESKTEKPVEKPVKEEKTEVKEQKQETVPVPMPAVPHHRQKYGISVLRSSGSDVRFHWFGLKYHNSYSDCRRSLHRRH